MRSLLRQKSRWVLRNLICDVFEMVCTEGTQWDGSRFCQTSLVSWTKERQGERGCAQYIDAYISWKLSSKKLRPAGPIATRWCYCWPILTLCYFDVHWRLPPSSTHLEPRISLVDPICLLWLCACRCEQHNHAYGNIGMKTWNENGLVTFSTQWNNRHVFTLVP